MSSRSGFRVVLIGASGALGHEVVQVLEERRFPIDELIPVATDRSLGEDVELAGGVYPVQSEMPPLRGSDLSIVCTPPEIAPDVVRESLRAEVPCIDCSGAMAASAEVPLYLAEICPPARIREAPLIAVPAGPALGWAHVLSALAGRVGLRRVVGTVFYSASHAGRRGIEALSSETLQLLNQQSISEPEVFPARVAFDCVPVPGEADDGAGGGSVCELALARDLRRLVDPEVGISVSCVQVPTFAGEGGTLAIETREPVEISQARELFQKVPGIELWDEDEIGPTTRDSAGRDVALVGRVRVDSAVENGLLLWMTTDTLRLAASNAVKVAETRLGVA